MLVKSLPALGAFGIALCISSGAGAAITVLGPGPAAARCTFALDTALTLTDRAATYVNRGVLKLSAHQNEGALADINSGIQIAPNLGDAYIDRGATSIALGHYEEALADLNKGLSLGPHRPQIALYDRAIVYEHNGDIRSAYEDYRKALDLAPDFAPAAEELKRFRVVHKGNGV